MYVCDNCKKEYKENYGYCPKCETGKLIYEDDNLGARSVISLICIIGATAIGILVFQMLPI